MICVPASIFPYSTTTLRYTLLTGAVELAPLRVLATRCVPWREWSVTFCVLGASHAVCLERGASRVTELLACAVGPGESVPVMQEDREQTTNLCLRAEGLVCEARLIPFALAEDGALLGESDPTHRLELAYPAPVDTPTPYTRIGWRVTPDALVIETVHTYPEEGRGVRSRTVFREEVAIP